MIRTSQRDARLYQVASLGTLLVANILWFDLGAGLAQSAVTLAAVLGWQWVFCRAVGVRVDPLSPLVTGCSLSLLLRSHEPWVWMAAPGIAMASKFTLRVAGKHVFNPAAFAIVALLGAGANVWVSPGQWGAQVWLVFLVVCLGGVVLARARRADTALAFLGCYAGLLALRAWSLGDPWAIPLHQMLSGSLLLFTFFMITDPKSTPDAFWARMVFAAAVAGLTHYLQFHLQLRTGLFWALAAVSLATPVLDRIARAERFQWVGARA